jgi:hypothetical protein
MTTKINKQKKNNRTIKKIVPYKPIYKDKKLCCMIRFYDNQTDIVQQFRTSKPLVEIIQVSSAPNHEIMMNNSNSSSYTQRFLEQNIKNPYARYLQEANIPESVSTVGFSRENGEDLKRWVKLNRRMEKAVLFDWDQTISVLEGIMVPSTREFIQDFRKKKITHKDIAVYYAGTKARLEYIRSLSDFLYKHKVDVYILTNNPLASMQWDKWKVGPESRRQFYHVVKEFFPSIQIQNILCGLDTDGFKPDVFLTHPILHDMYKRMEHWEYLHHSSF